MSISTRYERLRDRFEPTPDLSNVDAINELFEWLKPKYFKHENFNYDTLNHVKIQIRNFIHFSLMVDCKIDIDFDKRLLHVAMYPNPFDKVVMVLDMNPDFDEWVWTKCDEALSRIHKNIDLM